MANRADNFNRTGSVALGGSTPSDAGSAWVDNTSSFATGTDGGSGQVVAFETAPVGENRAWLECSATDHEASAEVIRVDDGAGVIARLDDSSNFYFFFANPSATELWKKVAGSYTKLADGSGSFTAGVGNTISIRCVGTSIKGFVGVTEVASVTDSSLTTGTKAGIFSQTNFNFFNSFSITDLTGGGAATAYNAARVRPRAVYRAATF